MLERLYQYLAYKLAPYLIIELQIGGHCGCCGKWVYNRLVETRWSWTLCDKCAEAGKKVKIRQELG